jgi:SNF2 family DNA or RNA helicase
MIDFGRSLGRTKTSYKEKYFNESFYGIEIKEGKEEQIYKQIEPFTLSMQVEDYLELPPCVNLTQEIYLPYDVMDQYQEFERELLLQLPEDQEIEAVNAAVLANKLLQFCNGAVYTDEAKNYAVLHDEKLDTLEEIIDTNDEPVLVAYNFKSDFERLKKRFPFAVHLGKNEETIESWNRGEIKMLLAHPQSAGHGLNLQKGGALCVWFSLCWSLENYMQLNKRLDGQGQTKPVRIIHLAVTGGIDERVLKVLSSKEKTQKSLLNALKVK